MDNSFSISTYPDAGKINKQLDELISKPIYSIKSEALKKYEDEYYNRSPFINNEVIRLNRLAKIPWLV